jgi:hypothetical protein
MVIALLSLARLDEAIASASIVTMGRAFVGELSDSARSFPNEVTPTENYSKTLCDALHNLTRLVAIIALRSISFRN